MEKLCLEFTVTQLRWTYISKLTFLNLLSICIIYRPLVTLHVYRAATLHVNSKCSVKVLMLKLNLHLMMLGALTMQISMPFWVFASLFEYHLYVETTVLQSTHNDDAIVTIVNHMLWEKF